MAKNKIVCFNFLSNLYLSLLFDLFIYLKYKNNMNNHIQKNMCLIYVHKIFQGNKFTLIVEINMNTLFFKATDLTWR